MLPREFLSQIADKYGLSPPETEVFLAKFSSNKSDVEIINQLNISDGTLRYRMGGVYTKFSISGKGPGKSEDLRSFLTNEYLKYQPTVSPPPDILPHDYPKSNTSEDKLDELLQKAQFIRVSPDKLEQVIKALDSMPSVIQAKNERERQEQKIKERQRIKCKPLEDSLHSVRLECQSKQYELKKRHDELLKQLGSSHKNKHQKDLANIEISPNLIITNQLKGYEKRRQDIDDYYKEKLARMESELLSLKREYDLEIKRSKLTLPDKISLLARDCLTIPRQQFDNFFETKEVRYNDFIEICSQLKLELRKIIDTDFLKVLVEIVPKLRSHQYGKIKSQCGTMKLLDISQPVNLNNLYVDVNILEELNSNRYLDISDLGGVHNPTIEQFDRFCLGKVIQERVPGIIAVGEYSKLMVLGKPGSGKSTFLQYLAIQCNNGEFKKDLVPIFIRLKNFGEAARRRGNFNLSDFIKQELSIDSISDNQIDKLLAYGKTLILLDGLDEVSEQDSKEVCNQVSHFSEKYFNNKIVITCRIAAHQYRFPGFTDVEVADFNQEQIKTFAQKWFVAVAKNVGEEGEAKATKFIEKLAHPENEQIRELAVTPILLNLTCLVFQHKEDFPSNKSNLYEEGVEILLVKWDKSRGIERGEVYHNLSLGHKIELLTQIASITFKKEHYFFEQKEIQQCIANYLRILPNATTDPVSLQQDSDAVLKSIEAQHGLLVERASGIYSFSHLTFQEYFTAKAIITSFERLPTSEASISYLTQQRWREIFLLTVGMMQNPDEMLRTMKQYIDSITASDNRLQTFLMWVKEKSDSVRVSYKPAIVRRCYFALASDLDPDFLNEDNFKSDSDIGYDFILNKLCKFVPHPYQDYYSILYQVNRVSMFIVREPELKEYLKHIEDCIIQGNRCGYVEDYTQRLKDLLVEHRNIGHNWRFTEHQKESLKKYYNGNKLLVECLNSGCQVTPKVRQEIENTLLLPIAEIEKNSTSPKHQYNQIS